MDTLTKAVKHSLFETKEQYLKMKEEWAKQKEHNVNAHLLYAILCGQDWRKAFSPITRPSKIANGAKPNNEGWFLARTHINRTLKLSFMAKNIPDLLKPFGDSINEGIIRQAWSYFGDYETPYLEAKDG